MTTTRAEFKFALSILAAMTMFAGAVAAESRVYSNAEATKPLQVGARVPSACIATVRGESVDLANQLHESGALLVFYRGGW